MSDPRNCLSYWYPLIEGKVPTPRTEIVRIPGERLEIERMPWGAEPPAWFNSFLEQIRAAARLIDAHGPWFLRTGLYSGKHDWLECCALYALELLGQQVYNLVEHSQLVDLFGLPCDVWVVREWLPGPAICEYDPFGGMPVRREFRAFAEAGAVLCVHPYWPAGALDGLPEELEPALAAMNTLGADEAAVRDLASRASAAVPGAWSIDVLATDRGWFVTDMALAHESYHWPECGNDFRKERA